MCEWVDLDDIVQSRGQPGIATLILTCLIVRVCVCEWGFQSVPEGIAAVSVVPQTLKYRVTTKTV